FLQRFTFVLCISLLVLVFYYLTNIYLNKAVGFELLIGVNFWWDYDGFIVAVTEVGVLTRPLLSVTVKLNVREIVVETVGAINVGFTVFGLGFRVTKGSDV